VRRDSHKKRAIKLDFPLSCLWKRRGNEGELNCNMKRFANKMLNRGLKKISFNEKLLLLLSCQLFEFEKGICFDTE